MVGSILLLLAGLGTGFFGFISLSVAKTVFSEIEALIILLCAVVFVTGAFIVSALNVLARQGKLPPDGLGPATDPNSRILNELQKNNELLKLFLSRFE